MRILRQISILAFAVVAQAASATGGNHWHVSTYWAEYIGGHGLGNHALYCGDETIPACSPDDTIGGVGRDWADDVQWQTSVADPSLATAIRLTGLMNYDLPDWSWDFVEFYVQRGDELELVERWTGTHASTLHLDFNLVLDPGDYSGPAGDEVRLVWRVIASADGWDDLDCLNPSHGACQLDDLAVYLDGTLMTFDDFEPGSPVHWHPVGEATTAVGDVPAVVQLAAAARPNPFNPQTTIAFDLPRAAAITLAVYDLQGRVVRQLLTSAPLPAGHHQKAWDGSDDLGRTAPSGTYLYRLTAGPECLTGKLTMLK